MKTEPNQSLQTISCSVTVAAEPICVPPHEMSDLKRWAKNMSYDYIIWKRSPKAKTAMLADVYRSICEGKDHPAMAPFDTEALESEIKKKFGDLNNDPDGPFLYGFDRGEIAPWLSISMGYSQVEALTDTIVELASTQGLMVYDPQRLTVWGNRRTQE